MKRLLVGALMGVLAATGSSTMSVATAAPAAGPRYNSCGYHSTTTVHLRSGPARRYTSLGLLDSSDDLAANKTRGGWYRVTLAAAAASGLKAGRTGWVAKAYLKPNGCTQLD